MADTKKARNKIVHTGGVVLKSSIDAPVVDVLGVSVAELGKIIRKHCFGLLPGMESERNLQCLALALSDYYTYLPPMAERSRASEFFNEMQMAFDDIDPDEPTKLTRVCVLFFRDDPMISKATVKGDPFFGPETRVAKYKEKMDTLYMFPHA
jgi:hypothetical protein